jgi:DNA-binding transcriptional ArsR family regulator
MDKRKHKQTGKLAMARKIDERTYSKYFKAFGDPTRLRILTLLAPGEMTVGEIVKDVGLSQPTVSRHLAILREAEVVVNRRDGQQVYYSLNKTSVENCCSGFCDCLSVQIKIKPKSKKK